MNRYWTALPIVVMAGVPVWTMPSPPVVAIEGFAALVCAIGMFAGALAPLTAGGTLGMIGYAVAVLSASSGIDAIGAIVFGIALLFLLDVGEFGARLRGAAISGAAIRGQVRFWFGRTVLIVVAAALLVPCASLLALVVPGEGRAVVGGIGVVIAFAGAIGAGVARRES